MKLLYLPLLLSTLAAYPITREEAIDFLYSGMSLPDSVDYSRQFYLDNVDASLRARKEMPWGESVPQREFLHFVLPVRVNNESLDNSRVVFYDELKERVKGLPMKEAILEVNHWCHEKVTYKPSDARTSSPLSSVSQAIGRCGEESTFTVAALRSVGIPARQIYTPRWAHTDDNHAWVEAWADGNWYFLGACEPEPVLNLAWFNLPASRGILMNTNVYGDYDGPEEVLLKLPLSTRINVTSNYAPTAVLPVEIVNPDGSPAKGARVSFCIYNYAEYYPAVTKVADESGRASMRAGLGDLVVWATDGERFGIAMASPRDYVNDAHTAPVRITLDRNASDSFPLDFNLVPPPAGATTPTVTDSMRAVNDTRLQQEDSIRQAYTSTFISPADAEVVARRLKLDEENLRTILLESRGNHKTLVSLLESLPSDKRALAMRLLLNVSEKDRRDIPAEVVMDHITYVAEKPDGLLDEVYEKYILNPRIENEALTPWRSHLASFHRAFPSATLDGFVDNPSSLADWIADNITGCDDRNPQSLRMSPSGVLSVRMGDAMAKKIFFVAMARSLGIPARIDPVTGATQFSKDGSDWTAVDLQLTKESLPSSSSTEGNLRLSYSPQGYLLDPVYYSQFSISKIENGLPRQLEFPEGATLSQIFSSPVALDAGQYILTSGQRMADGTVLAHSEVFSITPGETLELPLTIRQDNEQLSVIGSLNAENIYHDLATDSDKSILSSTGRGYYVLGLISPNHEPSAHALNDLSAVRERLEKNGRKIVILLEDGDRAARFDASHFPNLPHNLLLGIDNDGRSRKEIVESLHLDNASDPIFVVADSFNRIVWVSTGYNIGMGESILSVLSRLE